MTTRKLVGEEKRQFEAYVARNPIKSTSRSCAAILAGLYPGAPRLAPPLKITEQGKQPENTQDVSAPKNLEPVTAKSTSNDSIFNDDEATRTSSIQEDGDPLTKIKKRLLAAEEKIDFLMKKVKTQGTEVEREELTIGKPDGKLRWREATAEELSIIEEKNHLTEKGCKDIRIGTRNHPEGRKSCRNLRWRDVEGRERTKIICSNCFNSTTGTILCRTCTRIN